MRTSASRVLFPIALCVSRMLSPVGFQSQIFLGFVFPVRVSRIRVFDVVLESLAPQG